MSRRRVLFTAFLAGASFFAVSGTQVPALADPPPTEIREVFAPDGTIDRVRVPVVAQPPAPQSEIVADVVPIQETGPSDQRFDLVFVGDGYTESELAIYHQHVVDRWTELIQVEPFRELAGSFNVWQVNVVSTESGVSGDPTQDVHRDTALEMGFWCGDTERLLCVNETKAIQFAGLAPEVDQVLALANSTKYGGAGGEVATSSGGNEESGQIVPHELGHSIGGLADEYDYPDDLYTGPEPSEANVSVHTSDEMADQRAKWYEYLGRGSPDGGTVGTYEGAYYHQRGIYRPTEDSLMRSLGKAFNLISLDVMREALLAETG